MENIVSEMFPLSLPKQVYRPDEVAQILRVTSRTVYNWIQRGDLKAVKIGGRGLRIHRNNILRIIKEYS